jgi:hypothetical protein
MTPLFEKLNLGNDDELGNDSRCLGGDSKMNSYFTDFLL